jgi:hypothetical protein
MHGENQAMFLAILSQMQQMEAAQQEQYLNIMAQLQNMQGQDQTNFLALMNKLSQVTGNQEAILNAMQNMSAEFNADFASALSKLDAIEANQLTLIGQVANAYAMLQNINNGVQDNGETLEYIASILEGINLGDVNANLDVIKSLLNRIRLISQSNHTILQNMAANQQLILNVATNMQSQMASIVSDQEILLEWQEAIFNKIPEAVEACNCEECCQQLLEILIQIDEHIQNGDWNHEGIDDDLGDILG